MRLRKVFGGDVSQHGLDLFVVDGDPVPLDAVTVYRHTCERLASNLCQKSAQVYSLPRPVAEHLELAFHCRLCGE